MKTPEFESAKPQFHSVELPEGCTLRRKETYEYTTPQQTYQIELFENQEGTCYAMGVPSSGPMVVYGSNVVTSAGQALQVVVEKIERESPRFERE